LSRLLMEMFKTSHCRITFLEYNLTSDLRMSMSVGEINAV
jgi:hypothetical protein